MTPFVVPTAERVVLYVTSVAFALALRTLIALLFGRSPWRFDKNDVVFLLVQTGILVLRDELRDPLLFAYIAWCFLGSHIPWDKMKKKLGSTISSLTEVAKASMQRQQSEAFS
jgi:hypothetical protein